MDNIWDGHILPLRKSEDSKGITSVKVLSETEVLGEKSYKVEYTFNSTDSYTAQIDSDTYKEWKASGWSTAYYNDNIRIE